MKETGNYEIYAYCLMDNHVHLLLCDTKDEISRTMKRICVSYVYYFNKKYKRIGHLFQDRYRSEVVEEDAYLLSVARYIHKNPLKAGMVKRVEDYKWSSYAQYLSANKDKFNLIERSFLLSMFSDIEDIAKELF
ncbi:MAG: transposase [Firmicutes bacterium]|nr:transposase [Bacillota bacterium]